MVPLVSAYTISEYSMITPNNEHFSQETHSKIYSIVFQAGVKFIKLETGS